MLLKSNRFLDIGGIRVFFRPPPSVALHFGNRLYRSFFRPSEGPDACARLIVRLHIHGFPSPPGMEKVFDTSGSWSHFRSPGASWLVLAPEGRKCPTFMARITPGMPRLDLYCQAEPMRSGLKRIHLPFVYPLDQLVFMHYLARRQGLLAHAAGMVHQGRAFLFAGASGAGKSTFSRLLVEARFGKVLSDERMIVRRIHREFVAFGTPWAGTEQIARNGSAPLSGVFFLKHGKANRIEMIDPPDAADRILPMLSIPWYDPDTAAPIIAFAKKIFAAVPAWEFQFTPGRSAVAHLRRFLKQHSR